MFYIEAVKILFLLSTLLVLGLCIYESQKADRAKTQNQQTLIPVTPKTDTESNKQVVLFFGKGGGFTGTSKDFSLSYEGILSRVDLLGKTIEQVQILDPNIALKFFEKFDAVVKNVGTFHEPGNMSTYLKKKTSDSEQVMKWGASGFTPDTMAVNLYRELMAFASDNNK